MGRYWLFLSEFILVLKSGQLAAKRCCNATCKYATSIEDNVTRILVVKIGNRKEVYRQQTP